MGNQKIKVRYIDYNGGTPADKIVKILGGNKFKESAGVPLFIYLDFGSTLKFSFNNSRKAKTCTITECISGSYDVIFYKYSEKLRRTIKSQRYFDVDAEDLLRLFEVYTGLKVLEGN
jgi:hypothetical protein